MTIRFEDDFDRANNNTVGNGWTETSVPLQAVRINSNVLEFHADNNAGPTRTCHQSSTLLNTFIKSLQFKYGFTGLGSETLRAFISRTSGVENCGVKIDSGSFNLSVIENKNGGSPAENILFGPISISGNTYVRIFQVRNKLIVHKSITGTTWDLVGIASLVTNSPTQKTKQVGFNSILNSGTGTSTVHEMVAQQRSPRIMRANK